MKILKQEKIEELTEKVLNLIAKTSVEIGHRTDANTMATLSKIFAEDLIKEKRFGTMTWNQIEDAFHQGVRFSKDEPFLNIRTFYKWVYAHKKVIDHAEYQVRELGMAKNKVPFYQSPIKLLK
tara:strand:+ start:1790 stop:2158 length:369 start_codon:yes stop_codon:yes gene_type:complete